MSIVPSSPLTNKCYNMLKKYFIRVTRRNGRTLDFERAELGHRKESNWNIWPSNTIVEHLEALSS